MDGAFVSGNVDHRDLEIQNVFMEELSIVTSNLDGKSIFGKLPVKLIVFSKGCSYREILVSILEQKKIDSYKIIEIDTLEGIINSVEAGVGITLLPTELIKTNYSYRSLNMISPIKRFLNCHTQFIKRKDFPMEPIYELFFESIVKGYSKTADF
ncbi:LysR substrate-binding domain-containing protein [Chryseobacterium sp. GM_Chr_1]|uniref:LysR substrate-binding domain-containing protein n=1 Tax=unclassified Chryseobacterium TaxID=2593645 RepID=UPI003211D166